MQIIDKTYRWVLLNVLMLIILEINTDCVQNYPRVSRARVAEAKVRLRPPAAITKYAKEKMLRWRAYFICI
jgi:hypothetical protein